MPDNNKKYYLVEGSALPEVFIRVTQARELLDTGRAQTVAEAAAMAGISRSAYYKYRDAVLPFRDLGRGHIVTFQLLLEDVAGMLFLNVPQAQVADLGRPVGRSSRAEDVGDLDRGAHRLSRARSLPS